MFWLSISSHGVAGHLHYLYVKSVHYVMFSKMYRNWIL
jgi:hypothetical protein